MRRLKSIAGVIAGIFIFCEIVRGLNYIYVSENNQDDMWSRIMWHSFYEERGNIDNVFVGSSHVFCDINPYMLDERNQQCNFNLASSGQLMNGTYYLVREADRNNDLSHVYIELYYDLHVIRDYDDEEPIIAEYVRNWNNTDYMKFSINTLFYKLTMVDIEKYPETWCRFIRYRDKLSDWGGIADTLSWKKSEDYLNDNYRFFYREDDEWETEYRRKGNWYTLGTLKETRRIAVSDLILQENPMAESSEKYLRKTITYCQKRNIPVTLFVSPMYELQLISTENYDNYIEQVRGIAEEYHIDYYDFNLAREEYLPIQNPQYFMDLGHLNSIGADMFTEFFYQVISGNADENKKYFYDSYKEKLLNQEPEVFGIYSKTKRDAEENQNFLRDAWVASNRETEMEYRITYIQPDRGPELLQDFSENKKFEMNAEEEGTFFIEYRLKAAPDSVQTVEIEY